MLNRNVWKSLRRIRIHILGVKGLKVGTHKGSVTTTSTVASPCDKSLEQLTPRDDHNVTCARNWNKFEFMGKVAGTSFGPYN